MHTHKSRLKKQRLEKPYKSPSSSGVIAVLISDNSCRLIAGGRTCDNRAAGVGPGDTTEEEREKG